MSFPKNIGIASLLHPDDDLVYTIEKIIDSDALANSTDFFSDKSHTDSNPVINQNNLSADQNITSGRNKDKMSLRHDKNNYSNYDEILPNLPRALTPENYNVPNPRSGATIQEDGRKASNLYGWPPPPVYNPYGAYNNPQYMASQYRAPPGSYNYPQSSQYGVQPPQYPQPNPPPHFYVQQQPPQYNIQQHPQYLPTQNLPYYNSCTYQYGLPPQQLQNLQQPASSRYDAPSQFRCDPYSQSSQYAQFNTNQPDINPQNMQPTTSQYKRNQTQRFETPPVQSQSTYINPRVERPPPPVNQTFDEFRRPAPVFRSNQSHFYPQCQQNYNPRRRKVPQTTRTNPPTTPSTGNALLDGIMLNAGSQQPPPRATGLPPPPTDSNRRPIPQNPWPQPNPPSSERYEVQKRRTREQTPFPTRPKAVPRRTVYPDTPRPHSNMDEIEIIALPSLPMKKRFKSETPSSEKQSRQPMSTSRLDREEAARRLQMELSRCRDQGRSEEICGRLRSDLSHLEECRVWQQWACSTCQHILHHSRNTSDCMNPPASYTERGPSVAVESPNPPSNRRSRTEIDIELDDITEYIMKDLNTKHLF